MTFFSCGASDQPSSITTEPPEPITHEALGLGPRKIQPAYLTGVRRVETSSLRTGYAVAS